MSFELEQAFIELAIGDGVRRVQTPEGARFYDLPIGAVITADIIKKKKLENAAKGIKPPKGGLSKKPKLIAPTTGPAKLGTQFDPQTGKMKPGSKTPAPQPGANFDPQAKFNVMAPTIKGPNGFTVGNAKYSAPAGSKLIRAKKYPDVAYVVTPKGEVHVFNPSGEIVIPDYLEDVLPEKFKDLKSDDTLYKIDKFEAPSSLADQKPGAKLSKNGSPAFTKTGRGTWADDILGVELTDDDLQSSFESGKFDLESANTVEDIDFSKMSEEELSAALEAMPDGKTLKFANATLTKDGKKWTSDLTGASMDSASLASVAEGTQLLNDKLDNPEVEPEPGKKEKAEKDAKATDPLMDPEKVVNEANAQKTKAKSAKATGQEVLKSKEGDTLYHDQKGALTKNGKQTWETVDGEIFMESDLQASANSGYVSKEPWDAQMAEAKAQYDLAQKLMVDHKEVATIAKFDKNDRTEKIAADGGSTPRVFELDAAKGAKTFREAMVKSLENNPYSASVYIYDEKDYKDMRLFLADDGLSGVAIHDGDEIVSVFSDPNSKNKKVARHLISVAVENGATRLDAFDTVLPSIYAKEGFEVKARLEWNDEFAPEGWDKETFKKFNDGEPDVVFMKYNKAALDSDYVATPDNYVDDYDAGLASTGGKAQDENDYRPEGGDPDAETAPETAATPEDTQRLKELVGKVPTPEDIDALPVGSKVFNKGKNLTYTKNENGNWVTPNGGVHSAEQFKMGLGFMQGASIESIPGTEDFPDFEPQNPVPDDPDSEWEVIPEGGVQINDLSDFKAGDSINLQTPDGPVSIKLLEDGTWEEKNYGYLFKQEEMQSEADAAHVWLPEDEANDHFNEVESEGFNDPNQVGSVYELKGKLPGHVIDVNGIQFTKTGNGKWAKNGGDVDYEFMASDFKNDIENGYVKTYKRPTISDTEKALGKTGTKGFTSTKQVSEAIQALESHTGFQVKYGLKSLPEDHPLKSDPDLLDKELAVAKQLYPDLPPKKALIKSLKKSINQDEELADWEKALMEPLPDEVEDVQIGSTTAKSTATGLTGGQFSKKDIQSAIDILENYDGKLFKNELNKQGNPLGKLSPNDLVGFNADKTVTKQKFIDLLKGKVNKKEAPEVKEAKSFISGQEANQLPTGTTVKQDNDDIIWTKVEGGWTNDYMDDSDTPWKFSPNAKFEVLSSPESSEAEKTVVSVQELKDLPIGSSFRVKNSTFIWEKTGNDEWTLDGNKQPSSNFSAGIKNKNLVLNNVSESREEPDFSSMSKNEAEKFLNEVPVGNSVWFPATAYGKEHKFTKLSDGKWQISLNNTSAKSETLAEFKELITTTPQLPHEPGHVLTAKELKQLHPGKSVLVPHNNGKGFNKFTKDFSGNFVDNDLPNASPFLLSDFDLPLNEGKVTVAPDPVPGDTLQFEEQMNAMPPGSRVAIANTGVNYKKLQNGLWENEKTKEQRSNNAFKSRLDLGHVKAIDKESDSPVEPAQDEKLYIPLKPEQLELLGVGARLQLWGKNGAKGTIYEKKGDKWLRPNGDVVTDNHVKSLANQGLLESIEDAPYHPKGMAPKPGDKLDGTFDLEGARVGTVMKSGQGSVYTKKEDGTWAGYSSAVMQNALKSSAQDNHHYTLISTPEVKESPNTKLQTGDPITSMEQFQNLAVGDKVLYTSSSDASYKLEYTKVAPDSWRDPSMVGYVIHDSSFTSSISAGALTYEGNDSLPPAGDHFNEAESSLDSTVGTVMSQMKDLDEAVSILPADKRGANGDGFIVVHTDKGPKITWGKFGGGGIAAVATDENGVKKVLIGKRGDRDEWYLPGGAIDENETHLQGSLREFVEEVDDGESLLDNIKIVNGFQATIGKIDGTNKDWKYVTSVAELPTTMDIKAPGHAEPWELAEYKWYSAEELDDLQASGKLHSALAGDNLAKMVGFKSDEPSLEDMMADLQNQPDNLAEPKYDISKWKKVGGGQGGSNPGGVYEDELGNKFYVKESNGGDSATHNEIVAGALYKALGVNSNEVFLVKNGDSPTKMIASPWIENDAKALPNAFAGDSTGFIKKAQADFAIDAWLDNYDVAGIGPWNLVADEDGNPLRIDPGGAMMYRATGSQKSWWSDEPTAIDDMRFGSGQSSAYTHLPKLFGNMSDADVKESAKKLLNITPEQINDIVQSSGLDEDTKHKLQQTLVNRRQKILERFGLTEATEKPEAHSTPHFDLGSVVKVKGTNEKFAVEISNNEATAGLMDGKFMVFLNDELTDDMDFTPNVGDKGYAFTSNGETFEKVEVVEIPDPNNSAATVQGHILNADWSSGLVNVVVGPKVLQIDKTNIKKAKPAENVDSSGLIDVVDLGPGFKTPPSGSTVLAEKSTTGMLAVKHPDGEIFGYTYDGFSYDLQTDDSISQQEGWVAVPHGDYVVDKVTAPSKTPINLGSDYAMPPAGSTPLAKHSVAENVAVEHPDGTIHIYHPDGAVGPAVSTKEQFLKEGGAWKPLQAQDFEDASVDMNGDVIKVGDDIVIAKYNKAGMPTGGKIVSINTAKGTARIRRKDENGFPMSDANGKPMYANISLKGLRKQKMVLQPGGLPTGITLVDGDKNHPLFGKPEPVAPTTLAVPGTESDSPIVGSDWIGKAETAYAKYRSDKGLSAKSLQDSSTAWGPIQKAMKGDESSLTQIKNKGYLDADPALYEEIQKAIEETKAKYDDLVAVHEAKVIQYQKDQAEWSKANGKAAYTPIRHEDINQFSQYESETWFSKRFAGIKNKLSSKGKAGLQEQKMSSEWQRIIRKLPAILGLRREDVANAPGVHADNMKTWDAIQEAAETAGPIGEGFRAVRTISFDRLVGPDGKPLDYNSDLSQIIGSIQKDHGAMEINPNSLYNKGKVNDFYPVVMDLAVPPEAKGWYTGEGSFSHSGELGLIMEPGYAMYVWDAKKEFVSQVGESRWVVKASIIPRDVLPYMNNFEGDPMSHNIIIPGKDTTTGIPSAPSVPYSATSEDTPADLPDGEWSQQALDAAKVGKSIKDKFGAQWTKQANQKWYNNDGDQATSAIVAKNLMNDPWEKLMDSAPVDFKAPKAQYSQQQLANFGVGTIVTDADGDVWKKTAPNTWVLITKVGDGYVFEGDERDDFAVASYTKGLDNGI